MAGLRPLVGRASELAHLERAIGTGRGEVIVLVGEPGIGKSRLVDELEAVARRRGATVCRGTGEELERDRPFGPLVDALDLRVASPDARRGAVADLLASAEDFGPGIRHRVADEIADLAEAIAVDTPLVLVIEDLHWSDGATLAALVRVARRIAPLPVLLVCTSRPPSDESSTLARTIARLAAAGARIDLTQLCADDAERLAAAVLGGQPGPTLRTRLTGAGGNPLWITELVSALRDESSLELTDGTYELRGEGMPPSLRLTIVRRLAFLPSESVELLRVASILGTTFTSRELSLVSGRGVIALTADLRAPMTAGIVEEHGDALGFTHDVVREAVYMDMPASFRRALHMHAARVLRDAHAPPERVAAQAALGGERGDGDAVAMLAAAARRIAAYDPAAAADLLDRAIEIALEPATDLLVDAARAHHWAAHFAEAERLSRRPAAASNPEGMILRQQALAALGRFAEMREQARAMVSADVPEADRAIVVAEAAWD